MIDTTEKPAHTIGAYYCGTVMLNLDAVENGQLHVVADGNGLIFKDAPTGTVLDISDITERITAQNGTIHQNITDKEEFFRRLEQIKN